MRSLLWFIVCAAATARGGNLLVNPGFEEWLDDSTPAGWTVENRARTAVHSETDTFRSGSASARLVRRYLSTGNNYGVVQRVGVRAGTWYDLSFQGWDDNPEVSIGVGVSWRKQDSTYISSSGTSYSADSGAWIRVRDSVQAPGEAGWADFRVRAYAPSGMTEERRCIVDDVWFGTPEPLPETVQVWFAQDSLAKKLIAFFGQAQSSIDYCCYNSSRMDVVQAVIDAHRRGVAVRIVTDNTRMDDAWVEEVRAAGIKVWSDSIGPSPNDYMHNKFAVLDLADADSTNDRVWIASYNPNEGELRADFVVSVPVPAIARAYLLEFEQMWGGTGPDPVPGSSKFHGAKRDVLPTHEFQIDGSPAFVYFGPQDRPVDTIARVANGAQRHILFGVFAFTHDGLGDAMIARWQDSVWVGGVIDRSGINAQGSEYPRLYANGIPVYEDSVPFGEKIIHEKIMVIDSTITVAGSANWSANGNASNDENVMIMYSPGIARRFLAELGQRFWEATHPGIGEDQGAGFRYQGSGPSLMGSLNHLPPGVVVFDAAGRRMRSGASPAPGVYFVFLENSGQSPASDAAIRDGPGFPGVLRRVVVVR